MDIKYFDTYGLTWLHDYLLNIGLARFDLADGYYSLKNDKVICFINLGEKRHPNVDFRLAIDNSNCYNKIGQMPVSIDVTEECKELVVKWIKYLSSEEGFRYSNNFEYLDDETRPCYDYSKEQP